MGRSPRALGWVLASAIALLALLAGGFLRTGTRPGSEAAVITSTVPPRLEPESIPVTPPGPDPEARSDRRPSNPPDPGAGLAVFRLLDALARPVAGARVLVAREETLLVDGRSDARGEIALRPDGGPAQLVARLDSRPLELWPVRLDEGLQELVLPDRERLAGRLISESGGAVAGLLLMLDRGPTPTAEDALAPAVRAVSGFDPERTSILRCVTGEDGGFEFQGLSESWSGRLRLPLGWSVTSTSGGEVDLSRAAVRLPAPDPHLSVRIAAQPVLRGRLVSTGEGRPLPGADLCALTRGASREMAQATTDDDGRFELRRRNERIESLELRLGSRFPEGTCLLVLEGAAIPADGDLGDVPAGDVRAISFLLQRPSGKPIPSGTAIAAGIRSRPTGGDGRGVLRWIPRTATRLRAEAPGSVPVEVALAPGMPEPLVIELERANVLEVKLVLPEEGDPRQFRVLLRREAGVAAAPVRGADDQRAHGGEWTFAPYDLASAPHGTYLMAMPSAGEGVARFRALASGVPIELEVRGITGPAVYHRRTVEPMRPGETRRLEVALDAGFLVFRGRVLDAGGLPLRPARNVVIEVVDASGGAMPEAEVWILQEGFITNTHGLGDGRHVASSLTENPFRIEVRVGGRKYQQEHVSQAPEARVVVPLHGSVRATVAPLPDRAGKLTLVLMPASGEDGDPLVRSRDARPEGVTLDFNAVLPGAYLASLAYAPSEAERSAGRTPSSSAPVEVRVEAARRSEVRLALP